MMCITGVRRLVPDKFVFGVLDYYFAVGVLGFWAWDEFGGRIVTDSCITTTIQIQLHTQHVRTTTLLHSDSHNHTIIGLCCCHMHSTFCHESHKMEFLGSCVHRTTALRLGSRTQAEGQ